MGNGRDKSMSFSLHGWPPEVSLQEGQGVVHPRTASETGCVQPLEDLGTVRVWDKQAVRWTVTRVWLSLLCLFYQGLNLPGSSHNTGWGEDGITSEVLAGESIRFHISGARSVSESEVKPTKKQCPTRVKMLRVKMFCCLDIGKVFVVCHVWTVVLLPPASVSSPLMPTWQLTAPCCQHRSCVEIEMSWKEGIGMELWSGTELWEKTAPIPVSEASISMINWHERSGWTRSGAEMKRLFNSEKALSASGVQENWMEGEVGEGSCYLTAFLNETEAELCKS